MPLSASTRTITALPAALATVLGLGLAAPLPTAAAAPGAQTSLVARVAAESPTGAELAAMDGTDRVRSLARCYRIETETYCLGQGFVEERPDYSVLAAATAPAARAAQSASSTGALGFGDWVGQRTAMTDAERAAADAAEVRRARAGVAKAQALRELEPGGVRAAAVRPANTIMAGFKVRQRRSYWCGPATMQSIDWADDKRRESQGSWASDLGTTSGGTSIGQLVRVINAKTRWDAKAGPYIVQSVSTWGPAKFYEVHKRHLGDADPAPIVEHPRLLARHFHYLASDHGGHFQPGRGYYRKRNGTRMIRVYEVFNEADWTLGGRSSWGPREVSSFDMLAATKANSSFRNIGL